MLIFGHFQNFFDPTLPRSLFSWTPTRHFFFSHKKCRKKICIISKFRHKIASKRFWLGSNHPPPNPLGKCPKKSRKSALQFGPSMSRLFYWMASLNYVTLATCSSRLSPVVCSSEVCTGILQCVYTVCSLYCTVCSVKWALFCVMCEVWRLEYEVRSVQWSSERSVQCSSVQSWEVKAWTAELSDWSLHWTEQCYCALSCTMCTWLICTPVLYCTVHNNHTMCKLLICTTVLPSTSQLQNVQISDLYNCIVLHFRTAQCAHSQFVQLYCSLLHSRTMCT